jgi:hypothetical protein
MPSKEFAMKKLAAIFLLPSLLFAPLTSLYSSDISAKTTSAEIKLPNITPALDSEDDLKLMTYASTYCPVADAPFIEHARAPLDKNKNEITALFPTVPQFNKIKFLPKLSPNQITSTATIGDITWIGTKVGLYQQKSGTRRAERHGSYGVNGPLATHITALVADYKGNLWVGTPIGLTKRGENGDWVSIRGEQGLPVENITTLAAQADQLWIGTTHGVVLFLPEENDRQWFYRAGKRYLIDDYIQAISVADGGKTVYFKTPAGISRLDAVELTLQQKADKMEEILNTRHRRLGMVAACVLDDAENPASFIIQDNDNDGLWTSYHVVAMSLAYGATGEKKYLESAKIGMHAMIMLQNASGIPGLVARSVVPASERASKNEQWRLTPDGKMLWKSDTSSDEIDGHFFAFYAYWQHIARFDSEESALIKSQIKMLIDHIVDNNYQLIDWDGERTRWGFWNPENLNDDAEHYIENGLNAAQILSFLKVSFHITGDAKYKEHFNYLIREHGYLGNVLLQKKVFPDENNHSDNQLGFVGLYPWLQLEEDAFIRNALQRAARRHYKTLWRDGSAFFYFAAATIDPDFVDIKGAVKNLRQIPTDRRQWQMLNSHRADIVWNPRLSRFGRKQLLQVLPADERNWAKWNGNPYSADSGGDGRTEDDGGSWLLAYWMGRYHGFIDK